ncbi:MAG: hypothetical protein AAFR98_09880, partial [Pseudomonadota bacterium]
GDPGDTITYSFTATNSGNTSLAGVEIDDTKLSLTDAAITPANLGVGDSGTLTGQTYVIQLSDYNDGFVENTAVVSGLPVETDGSGDPIPGNVLINPDDDAAYEASDVTDTSDTGTEPDLDSSDNPVTIADPAGTDSGATGDAGDDPTILNLPDLTAAIVLVKTIDEVRDDNLPFPDGITGFTGDTLVYSFTVTNTGQTALDNVTITDPLLGLVDVAVTPSVLGVGETGTLTGLTELEYTITETDRDAGEVVNTASATGAPIATQSDGTPNPAAPLPSVSSPTDTSDTGTEPELDSGGNLVPVSDPEAEDTNGTPGDDADEPTVFMIPIISAAADGDWIISKAVIGNDTDVLIGDLVSYEMTITNNTTDPSGVIDFVDILPVGLTYVSGSATVESSVAGGAVPTEPNVSGQRLEFPNLLFANGEVKTVILSVRVNANAPVGELTNRAFATDPLTGEIVSNTAEASVDRVPEHVFDCSDIIGKVFDDRNHNGYQDPPDENGNSEPGLPGARVVTINGVRITTDEYGRFHIPCAELPDDIGTNFILKLDERSLPSGYRLTTENPRVVRLTAGKFAKMNFGASISNVIRIDVNERAFTGANEPNDRFKSAIGNLLIALEDQPSVLRVTYVFNDNAPRSTARARVRSLEKYIQREWRTVGRYKLNIERTIKVPQAGE